MHINRTPLLRAHAWYVLLKTADSVHSVSIQRGYCLSEKETVCETFQEEHSLREVLLALV